jgi:hypothetical protein
LDRKHPLTVGMALATIPLWRSGQGPPGLVPGQYSLREVIKTHEAIYVAAIQDEEYTHELLIGAIAGQMGSAHEAEGLDHRLVRLHEVLINQEPLYGPVLGFDAELTLRVGERVLAHAEQRRGYRRTGRPRDHGDVTLALRIGLREPLVGRVPVFTFRAGVSEVHVTFSAGPRSAVFSLYKRGVQVGELLAGYPPDWSPNTDALFALSYCSAARQARTITNAVVQEGSWQCDLGWIDAREISPPHIHKEREGFVYIQNVLTYGRLLSTKDCGELMGLSPDLEELMLKEPPTSPFPQ